MSVAAADQLARALDATEQVIAAIRDEQWAGPTPCPEWDVRDLVSHLVLGNRLFTSVLGGERPPVPEGGARADVGRVDGDLLSAYRDTAGPLLAAFREPGVLEQVVAVPAGSVPGIVALHLRVTELLVHGWDLAHATGQPARFPDDLAEQELEFTRAKLADLPPDRHPFAPPQPVSEAAPAIDRLAACLGRRVAPRADADRLAGRRRSTRRDPL